jgi:drug/metabolite transporter superfamily protein YnfA
MSDTATRRMGDTAKVDGVTAAESPADAPLAVSPIRPLAVSLIPLARLWLWLANHMQFLPWIAFALAAIFEVGGDAVVRMGIKTNSIILMLLGAATLGGYGLIVNSVDWNFSKIFGVYVGAFALVAILFGKFVFREQIPISTWVGLAIIIAGGLVIQFGK